MVHIAKVLVLSGHSPDKGIARHIAARKGGGDAFAAGIVHGLLEGLPPRQAIDYAVVHGALTMTTPGDNSMVTLADLDRFLEKRDAGVLR